MKNPVVIDGHEYTTRGSLIYGRTLDQKRPYTYHVRKSRLRKLSFWPGTEYTYDLISEAHGKLYPSQDPLSKKLEPNILDFLTECRQHGRKVLVHCIMGVNRAAWATVAFLSGSMGMSLKAAITLAAEKRGCVLSNASFLDQLIFSFATKEDLDDTSGSISR
eukprot:s438_g1.t3